MTREEAIEVIKDIYNYTKWDTYITNEARTMAIEALKQEPTTKNDLALINTEGLDEDIRCAMCTNSMANDRGCDGGCVVNNALYKKVMDVIESHIAELPSVTPQESILNKIRAEIVELQKDYHEYGWAYDDALDIIDKYRESEE